jgi:hypothetical protein
LAAGVDIDYEQMREFVESGGYEIESPTMEHLRVELPTIDHVMPTIAERKWMLFRAPPGLIFVTSDARDQHFCNKFNHNVEIRRGAQLLDDPGLFGSMAAES